MRIFDHNISPMSNQVSSSYLTLDVFNRVDESFNMNFYKKLEKGLQQSPSKDHSSNTNLVVDSSIPDIVTLSQKPLTKSSSISGNDQNSIDFLINE